MNNSHVDIKSLKSHISARQHKSCDRWSNRHKPDERNKEMMSLIRPLITRLLCETAAVLTLVIRRCGHCCMSAGLICTGSTSDCTCWSPTAVFAGTRQQDSLLFFFFFFLKSFNYTFSALFDFQWPTMLQSSTPSWPKWRSLDGRDTTSCNWFESLPRFNQSGGPLGGASAFQLLMQWRTGLREFVLSDN